MRSRSIWEASTLVPAKVCFDLFMKRRFQAIAEAVDKVTGILPRSSPPTKAAAAATLDILPRAPMSTKPVPDFDFIEREEDLFKMFLPGEEHRGQRSREKLVEVLKRYTDKLAIQTARRQGASPSWVCTRTFGSRRGVSGGATAYRVRSCSGGLFRVRNQEDRPGAHISGMGLRRIRLPGWSWQPLAPSSTV